VAKYTHPDTPLRREMGLENKFIAIYGGNFGLPQKAEFILDLAEHMMIHEDVIFLLIGDGSEKKRLTELATEKNLTNVIFRDPLPQVQYNELVKICNIGLVNLSEKFTIPNIPSRTLSYWEAKIPVLAAIDTNTDFGDILALSESGLSSFTGDIDSYIKNFEKLYADKELRSKMGENGYRYLKDNCTVDMAYSIINEKLSSK
jgi:glycosyltransferase involved in cell wall biosynthesis